MISWIKYAPFKLRESDSSECEAAGPKFKKSQSRELNVGGNKIRFTAPRSSLFGKAAHTFDTGSNDALKYDDFKIENKDLVATENWHKTVICVKEWTYNGAWFLGRQATTQFAITLHKRVENKKFKGEGFLNPKSFEFAIANLLDNYYGHRIGIRAENSAKYNGPLSWTPIENMDRPAVTFQLYNPAVPLRFFIFPVTQDILAIFEFAYYGNNAVQKIQDELPLKIIDSVRLIPSEEVSSQLKAVEKSAENNQKLSKDLGPFNWPINVEQFRQADEEACDPNERPMEMKQKKLERN
ncbi:hypothetical protein TDB9533_00180 [Thalassocella blandensis]|nr:hypothetical protein TDB9533_00180 [Thalassocella blandensis]